MRRILMMFAAAVLLAAPPAPAQTAQAPQPGQNPSAPAAPIFTGTVDLGGQFTSTDGDEARFERYRDSRSGLFSGLQVNRETGTYFFSANASHIGYRDQRYNAAFMNRRVSVVFDWTSLPLNFSYIARTPFTTNGTTLTLDDAAQAAVQGPTNAANDGTAVGVPCAPGSGPTTCSAATAAAAIANRSIYNNLANAFEMRHRRDTAVIAMNYMGPNAVDVDARFTSSMREGTQPWGASFAFNNAIELPLPLDQRTNDLNLGASWVGERAMFRLGWDGSWFNNQFQSLVWDNPIRISDFNNGLLPPGGPYDPSGYSNGNGPAQGRQALAPDNVMNVVSATGLYRFARRTTLNGTLQFTSQTQDEELIPFTINQVVNNTPAVLATFPRIAQLPRTTAEAEARGVNALINLNSRPYRRVNFTVRYRYNERDVQTPTFDAREYVRFDAVPEEIEEGLSHQYDNSRHIFDANVSFTPSRWGTLRVGYGHEAVARQGRGFSDVGENILRLSFDTFASRFVTARASLDVARRRGEGFVEAETGNDEDEAILGPGGTQPTLRYFDEADRDRVRGSVMLTIMPRDVVDFFVQIAAGRDEYLPDDFAPVSRPGELIGLQESTIASWNVGVNFHPGAVVSLGASYGRETYGSFQISRNANPPPDPTWTDPNRNWDLDNDDEINNFNVYVDLLRALRNTDIRFAYDFSDSNNSFVFGGPRIAALAAVNQFIPLPDVENSWHRASADVQYFFTSRAGVGVGYYFEKLDVVDFNTIDSEGPVGLAPRTETPRVDWLGGLITGYGNRPYTGHTAFVRVLYRLGQ